MRRSAKHRMRVVTPLLVGLSLLLVLVVAGVPSVLHFSLLPHRWCPLHHQMEHVDSSPAASQRDGGPAAKQANVTPDDAEDHETNDQACHLNIQQQPAAKPAIVALPQPRAPPPVVLLVHASTSIFFHEDVLSNAPKRSPPLV